MALSIMTKDWSRIANEITVFVIRKRRLNEDGFQKMAKTPRQLFNCWSDERGVAVEQSDLAIWCLRYLGICASLPLRRLEEAAVIDGLI